MRSEKGVESLLCNAEIPALTQSPKRSGVGQRRHNVGPAEVREYCPMDDAGKSLLRAAMTQLGMGARAFHCILKLARTIADLEDVAEIQTHQPAEAIQYRSRRQL